MIAADLAQRYAQGESLRTLAQDYHLDKRTIAKTVRAMGVVIRPAGFNASRTRAGVLASERKAHDKRMATGAFCKRCEILLSQAPTGGAGLCGYCLEGR